MGRYWSVETKDMYPIPGGFIRYRVRKNWNTGRWELTIRRKMHDWSGLSDIVMQSTSWHALRLYAIDHWNVAKRQGLL